MNAQRNKSRDWSWEATSAACCFGGGMLAALIGSVITAINWFIGAALHAWLSGTGTALLIATIPLLIFSGYCLDWSERKEASLKPHRTIEPHTEEGNGNDLVRN